MLIRVLINMYGIRAFDLIKRSITSDWFNIAKGVRVSLCVCAFVCLHVCMCAWLHAQKVEDDEEDGKEEFHSTGCIF